jgi:hypothetical protein
VRDIFIGCVDGLKGFPEAMAAVFPETQVQLCRFCKDFCVSGFFVLVFVVLISRALGTR